LPDAAKNISQLEESVVPDLAKLLADYGLHDRFNIWLAHRHFLLSNENDRIVELQGRNISVSSVFTEGAPDSKILDNFDLSFPAEPAMIPNTFLSHGGRLLPMEYLCLDRNDAEAHLFTTANVTKTFLGEWDEVLARHNVEHRFGLALRTSDDIDLGGQSKLQYFDSFLGVDITVENEGSLNGAMDLQEDSEFMISGFTIGVPAVWKVTTLRPGMTPSIIRERRCWGSCPNCGGPPSATDPNVCGLCGARL
jgi:hypothetical protein